jgi:hypothetical protein
VEEFLDIADEVLVLEAGRVMFAGPTEEFLEAAAEGRQGLPVPATVAVQAACRERGAPIPRFEADPERAARMLLGARDAS